MEVVKLAACVFPGIVGLKWQCLWWIQRSGLECLGGVPGRRSWFWIGVLQDGLGLES